MMSRSVRSLALAAFLSTGLVGWSGCSTENPDGTKNALGKTEDKIKEEAKVVGDKTKELGHKAAEGAKAAGEEIKKDTKAVVDKVKGTETPAPTPPTPPVETPK